MPVEVVLFSLLLASFGWAAETPHWSYSGERGPQHWAQLSQEFILCSTGTRQSPVEIERPLTAALSRIDFSYSPTKLRLLNNGHTIQETYGPGSFMQIENLRYELVQFHFHHPSEHRIAGKRFPLEIHLVHQDDQGRLAVVAVLVKEGRPNPALAALWKQLPRKTNQELQGLQKINAMDLLPPERSYYAFDGSLTTPPCTEGVSWFVLKNPIEASAGQIEKFARLFPHNARPVQPVNGRLIRFSQP